jgi:hypothetical protein
LEIASPRFEELFALAIVAASYCALLSSQNLLADNVKVRRRITADSAQFASMIRTTTSASG